ncbi:protein phosphatase CheZ [Paraburkholderia phymatum]|uniref:protein phosphatase CheZ n=1 Tax=Paraburkholderia phymatum TaxID=148447 RepID=UPI003F75625B
MDEPLHLASPRSTMNNFSTTKWCFDTVWAVSDRTLTGLLEIITLAEDFQDLTGQVIKKITDIVSSIEQQLLSVLTENIAPERREQFAAQDAALASESSSKLLMNQPARQGGRVAGPVTGR